MYSPVHVPPEPNPPIFSQLPRLSLQLPIQILHLPSIHPLHQRPSQQRHKYPKVHLPSCPRCFLLLLIAVFNAQVFGAMNTIYTII